SLDTFLLGDLPAKLYPFDYGRAASDWDSSRRLQWDKGAPTWTLRRNPLGSLRSIGIRREDFDFWMKIGGPPADGADLAGSVQAKQPVDSAQIRRFKPNRGEERRWLSGLAERLRSQG